MGSLTEDIVSVSSQREEARQKGLAEPPPFRSMLAVLSGEMVRGLQLGQAAGQQEQTFCLGWKYYEMVISSCGAFVLLPVGEGYPLLISLV